MKKLRIAQIAPLFESVPPDKYGGTERVVYELTEELVKRGHDVTLFASGDSKTSAQLISVASKALWSGVLPENKQEELSLLNIGLAYSMQKSFDIIHDHTGFLSLPTANIATTPVVLTMHGEFTDTQRFLLNVLSKPNVITISKSQTKSLKDVKTFATVYNGLSMKNYPFSSSNDGYLLYVGRICNEKGTHIAINVAEKLNLPLIIAAKLHNKDVPYFEKFIKPKLLKNNSIKWIGEVDQETRNKLMSRALCFLHPTNFEEPFGLTLIEAGACGAPVVAIEKGSIPEIIKNGINGFVVKNEAEMIKAVKNISKIDRYACRKYATQNFSAVEMAANYESVYYRIINEKNVQNKLVL